MNKCIYAIGDIHGHFDLLQKLMSKIDQDVQEHSFDEVKIIFLGDYVDRGPSSKQVIDYLMSDFYPKFEKVFLFGNHEELMVGSLAFDRYSAAHYTTVWLHNGGRDTLQSYGIVVPEKMQTAMIRERVPSDHVNWMKNLPFIHIEDEYVFVHAGVDPGVPLDMQVKDICIWIREKFLDHSNPCKYKVVHGHTPTDGVAYNSPQRINVDTGVYITNTLTAVALHSNKERFIYAIDTSSR